MLTPSHSNTGTFRCHASTLQVSAGLLILWLDFLLQQQVLCPASLKNSSKKHMSTTESWKPTAVTVTVRLFTWMHIRDGTSWTLQGRNTFPVLLVYLKKVNCSSVNRVYLQHQRSEVTNWAGISISSPCKSLSNLKSRKWNKSPQINCISFADQNTGRFFPEPLTLPQYLMENKDSRDFCLGSYFPLLCESSAIRSKKP